MASLAITRIAHRRSELGLSQRALARAMGVGEHTINLLEKSTHGHEDYSLRFLRRLADALGVRIASLLDEETHCEPMEAGDIARVLAAICSHENAGFVHQADITWSLQWSTQQTEAALSAAAHLLPTIGLRLQIQPGVGVRIASSTDVMTDAQRADLLSAVAAREGAMTMNHVREMRRVARGELGAGWQQHASQNTLMSVAGLLKRKIAECREDGSVTLTSDAAFSLLTEELDQIPAGGTR